jgi:hypothetical protein
MRAVSPEAIGHENFTTLSSPSVSLMLSLSEKPTVMFHHGSTYTSVAYPGILFGGAEVQQIQLRAEDRVNGDLGAAAS